MYELQPVEKIPRNKLQPDYVCHSMVKKAWDFQPHSTIMHAFSHLIAKTKNMLIHWWSSSMNALEKNL